MTIVIISLNYDSFSNPTLQTLFEELERSEVQEVFFCTLLASDLLIQKNFPKIKHVHLKAISLRSILQILVNFKSKRSFELFLIDPPTIPYILLGWFLRLKTTYFSFEIFFLDEANKGKTWTTKILNKIKFSYWNQLLRKISNLVIQDRTRLLLINLPFQKVFLCPVAPSISYQSSKKTTKINEYKIIYSGSISQWSGVGMLLDAVKNENWPSNATLYLHSKFSSIDKTLEREIVSMKEKGYRVHLDLQPIDSFKDYIQYLSGFHIGLSFYFPTYDSPYNGQNITYLGLSSGKSNTYLSQGIPFISTPNNEYESLNEKNKFCYLLNENTSKEVVKGVMAIMNEYETYTTNASKLFATSLAPNKAIRALISDVTKVNSDYK